MRRKTTIDFEGRSCADLPKVGAWRYAEDESTEIICLAFKTGDEDTVAWIPPWVIEEFEVELGYHTHPETGRVYLFTDDPSALWQAIEDGDIIEAHNAFFERALWRNIMTKKYAWPDIPDNSWMCSAAKAASYSLPRGLDGRTVRTAPLRARVPPRHVRRASRQVRVRSRVAGAALRPAGMPERVRARRLPQAPLWWLQRRLRVPLRARVAGARVRRAALPARLRGAWRLRQERHVLLRARLPWPLVREPHVLGGERAGRRGWRWRGWRRCRGDGAHDAHVRLQLARRVRRGHVRLPRRLGRRVVRAAALPQ